MHEARDLLAGLFVTFVWSQIELLTTHQVLGVTSSQQDTASSNWIWPLRACVALGDIPVSHASKL
jgi:hypothetical protein